MESKKILMSGNEAMAEGAIQSGCLFYAGYPITPQSELTAYMAKYMPDSAGVFIQAESELAAINMVFGASAVGVRAMTSSSSPGISLKQEGISYLAGAELPAVIVNVMRGGPGLGNIAPSQSDYFQATKGGGHGDYHLIVIAPSSVKEAFSFMQIAFDLADKYRNPVMILGDGILGQMMEPVEIPNSRPRIMSVKKPWALTGSRDREPNIIKSFYMQEGELEKFNLVLQKKYSRIQKNEELCETLFLDDAEVAVVAYGSVARIVKSVIMKLRAGGKKVGLIRPITLWPFPAGVFERLKEKKKELVLFAIEMSYGQMVEDVRLAVSGCFPVEFLGCAGGGIPNEKEIEEKISRLLR